MEKNRERFGLAVPICQVRKITRIMKLTVLLMTILISQAFATSSYSQGKLLSLRLTNSTVKDVLIEIEKNSEFYFLYSNLLVDVDRKINVDLDDKKIEEVLDDIFQGTETVFVINDRQIILKPNSKDADWLGMKQDRTVTGKVVDENGQALPGVTVMLKGTTQGTVTDFDGNYTIADIPPTGVLIFSFVGMRTQEIVVGNQMTVNVTMAEDAIGIEEVVAIGYGTVKAVNVTGAVAQVGEEELKDRPVSNIGQILQGKVANLNVATTDGAPGAGPSYNIRGTTSINGGGPLFVVDGIPVDNITDLNPSDIKTFTVLKDAASAAIYGARAAYGVIMVTTKQGDKNEKISITYNNSFGFSNPTHTPNQVNSLDFAESYNIASANSGQSPMFTEEHIQRIKNYIADPENYPSNVPDPNKANHWSYANLDNDNVDWWRAFFKNNRSNQKHNVGISGGGENVTYYIGGGYYTEGGFLRYANEDFDRYNLTSNIHTEPTEWMRVDLRTRYYKTYLDKPSDGYNGDIGNWAHLATTRFPNWSLYDPNGHLAATAHLGKQTAGRTKHNNDEFSLSGILELEPIKDWKINFDYTYRNHIYRESTHTMPHVWEYTIDEQPIYTSHLDAYSTQFATTEYNSFNFYTSYTKDLGEHSFYVLLGQQVEENNYKRLYGLKRDLISHDIPSIAVGVGDTDLAENLSQWATMGTFARLKYNFKEKYLIEFNARYDGTSKFPEGDRFGLFPSVSVAYNMAKENYWNLEFVDSFKLRSSYGSLGNQNVANYLYLSTIGIGTKYPYIIDGKLPNYLGTPGLVSESLTWEVATTFDVGFDAALLGNRLTASFDWYRRVTTDMIGPAEALPSVLGTSVPTKNNADLETKGFELTLGWKDRIGKEFDYSLSFVLSDYKSKVLKYNNPTKLLSTYYEGMEIGEIWGMETVGIIQTEEELANMPDQSLFWGNWSLGDIQYRDLDGNGTVDWGESSGDNPRTLDNPGDRKVIGNSTPRFNFGLNGTARWKGFDARIFLQGTAKRDLWVGNHGNGGVLFWGFTGGFGSNLYEPQLDFWTPDNTDAYYPKPYNSREIHKNQYPQTKYLQNGAYLRLKNIQLGYTLPRSIMNDIGFISKIRVFVTGENLFTISSLPEMYDPELTHGWWGAGKVYPITKTYALGVNVNF